jgi:LEA14-like dessication related protein
MRLMRNLFMIIFMAITLSSIILISYSMYLYSGAYTLVDKFDVSMRSEPRIENSSSSTDVSVTTSFLFTNPSTFSIRLAYVSETLYLNGQKLGEQALDWYEKGPLEINPNVTVSITVGSIPVGKVSQSSKSWHIELSIILFNMPITDKGFFSRSFNYPS